MQNKDAFIIIKRSLFDHWVWNSGKFSKGQAWVDLIRRANVTYKKLPVNGEFIGIKRGQIFTSIEKLSAAWKWSRDSVRKFLNLLESDGMLTRNSNNHFTIITLNNYNRLNDVPSQQSRQPGHNQATAKATTKSQPGDTKVGDHPPQSNNQINNNDDNNQSINSIELYTRKKDDDWFFIEFKKVTGHNVYKSEEKLLGAVFKHDKSELKQALAIMRKNGGKSMSYLIKVLDSQKNGNGKPDLLTTGLRFHRGCDNPNPSDKAGYVWPVAKSKKLYCENCGKYWDDLESFQKDSKRND